MPKTISNFLVGVGFDMDKKSMDGVSSGISGIASKALQLGSVVAGAFGLKSLTMDFAAVKDEMGKLSEVYGGTANDIQAFGNALSHEGGTVNSFISQMVNLEKLRAGYKVGDAGFIGAAGAAGLDTAGFLKASTAMEGYIALADEFAGLSKEQRINAAAAMGLDDASIRLLSKGRAHVEAVIEAQRNMRPITDEMTAAARDFNDELQDMNTNIGSVTDRLGVFLSGETARNMMDFNELFKENREVIGKSTEGLIEGTVKAGETLRNVILSGGLLGYALGDDDEPEERTDFGALDIQRKTFNSPAQDTKPPAVTVPVTVNHQTILDGQVIDKRITKTVGEMADRAVTDLKSTEGG